MRERVYIGDQEGAAILLKEITIAIYYIRDKFPKVNASRML